MPDIESLRIFDENGKVTKSADKNEVGLTIEDIGLEIFKAGVPSMPYRGGHGYNAFCMVETIRNDTRLPRLPRDRDRGARRSSNSASR